MLAKVSFKVNSPGPACNECSYRNPRFPCSCQRFVRETDLSLQMCRRGANCTIRTNVFISYEGSVRHYMPHPDLNELLNALLPMAERLLKKQGEFYPIGAIMLSDGEIRHVGVKIEGDDHPPSQSLIDLLTETFQKEATKGNLRAGE